MIFWMSEEIQSDVADKYARARRLVEKEINRLLADASISEPVDKWAFIAIVRHEDHPAYGEIVRKSSRGKCLEFRLKIIHSQIMAADPEQVVALIFASLSRSVSLMNKLGVSNRTQSTLSGILADAQRNVMAGNSF